MNNKFKPGEGRRKKFAFDKGRQVDLLALEDVKALVPFDNIRRDHLIEYLHFLQDEYKFLYAKATVSSVDSDTIELGFNVQF